MSDQSKNHFPPAPDSIWTQMPELQNRNSSSWWFFLLLPEQAEGYGPKQMMFVLASRAGETVAINRIWQPGLDLKRPRSPFEDQFNTHAHSWIYDGERMHSILNQPIVATVSKQGYVGGWVNGDGRQRYGAEIRAGDAGPFSLEAVFEGPEGYGRFTTWGDERSETTRPFEATNIVTPLGGANMIAWRRLSFRGEFCSPGGMEQLQGVGYFQRVSLNVPAFPWKWIYAVFEDKSIFSGYIPYVGLNFLRKGDWFYADAVESKTISISQNAFFVWGDSLEMVRFNRLRVTPHIRRDEYPDFTVECRSAAGDHIAYRIESYAHAQVLMDRPLLKGRLLSSYNYNEYMFRVKELRGVVGGRDLTQAGLGNGFGNIEYNWGLGI